MPRPASLRGLSTKEERKAGRSRLRLRVAHPVNPLSRSARATRQAPGDLCPAGGLGLGCWLAGVASKCHSSSRAGLAQDAAVRSGSTLTAENGRRKSGWVGSPL